MYSLNNQLRSNSTIRLACIQYSLILYSIHCVPMCTHFTPRLVILRGLFRWRCGSLRGILPVYDHPGLLPNIRESNNKRKSSFSGSWTIYSYKHNTGVVDRKLNEWLPGKFKMFSLNKLLHGWSLPTWGSPPCRLALVSDRLMGQDLAALPARLPAYKKKLKRDRTISVDSVPRWAQATSISALLPCNGS